MNSDRRSADALTLVLEQLAGALPELVQSTCARIMESQQDYASVSFDSLEASIRRNMTIAVESLKNQQAPNPDGLDMAEVTTAERFAVGIPIEQIILAFRTSISDIHERFVRIAMPRLDPEAVLRGSRVLWDVGDSFVARAVNTYHRLQAERDAQNEAFRVNAIRDLLTKGTVDREILGILGLDPRNKYAALVTGPIKEINPETLRRQLIANTTVGTDSIIVVDGQRCIGVVASRPTLTAPNLALVPVCIGDFRELVELPDSWNLALLVRDYIAHKNECGVFSPDDLSWRLGVVALTGLSQALHEQYILPATRLGTPGTVLLETVDVWLQESRRVPATADRLCVHVNTIRYRLEKYFDLTGFDPDSRDQLIEITWAMETWNRKSSSSWDFEPRVRLLVEDL